MPAGRLRHRVTLQWHDPDAVPNLYNETPLDWIDLLSGLPADVYAIGGREFNAAQQVQSSLTHRVVIRAPGTLAVKPEYRFIWIERLLCGDEVTHYLDIKQVIPLITQRGFTECLCTEHSVGSHD